MRATITVLLFSLAACGGQNRNADHAPPPQEDTSIGIGDVFDVRVYGEEELSSAYRVAEDGSIDFPFVGRVPVVGLDPPDIAAAIATRLEEGGYLVDPQVSVFVQEYNSKRISVVGAVAQPGTFPFTPGMTVLQAISAAGGFTALASANDTVLTRTQAGGDAVRVPVRAGQIAEGRAQDIPLQAGDLIYIPERLF